MTISVTLTPTQMVIGAFIGCRRQIENVVKGRKHVNAGDKKIEADWDSWQMHVEACLSEQAVAQWLGIYWDGALTRLGEPDVGPYEVRQTPHDGGHLLLQKDDKKDSPKSCYILAVGYNGSYRLVGWLWGWEGKQEHNWNRPGVCRRGRPCFAVRQVDLHPIHKLPAADVVWRAIEEKADA